MALFASDQRNAPRTPASSSPKAAAQAYLTNCRSLYSCIYCRTHLANHDELVSRSFQGNHGRAYLFNSVINVSCGPAVQRELNTGSHAVADIFCANCATTLGWKYERAYVETQKYKEGKYIIELAHVVRENRHLELDKGERFLGATYNLRQGPNPAASRCHTGSISPPSSTKWSSQASSPPNTVDDDDDELMFPFYDELLCTIDRSSYPSSLSNSHHNRMRRTLYLDSTPYDWKHSTSDASGSPADVSESSGSDSYVSSPARNKKQPTPKLARNSSTSSSPLASSMRLSDLSPSTSLPGSSSSDILSENQSKQSYQHNNGHAPSSHDPRETQFEFEADIQPESCALANYGDRASDDSSNILDHCDSTPNEAAPDHTYPSQSSNIASQPADKLANGSAHDSWQVAGGSAAVSGDLIDSTVGACSTEAAPNTAPATLNISTSKKATPLGVDSGSNQVISRSSGCLSSISLDDEEFYDCCADHEAYELIQPQH